MASFAQQSSSEQTVEDDGCTALPSKITKTIKTRSMLKQPRRPNPGQLVAVTYIGSLMNGDDKHIFDEQQIYPFRFTIDSPNVISGWNFALKTMSLGESSSFVFPSEYGYGEVGSPPDIPPNATLTFEITLVSIDGLTVSDAENDNFADDSEIDPVIERLRRVRLEREVKELERQDLKKLAATKKALAQSNMKKKLDSKKGRKGKKK